MAEVKVVCLGFSRAEVHHDEAFSEGVTVASVPKCV